MMSGRGKAEAEEGGGEGNQLLVQRLQLHLMMKQWKWMIHSYRRHYHHSINNIHLISRRHSSSNNNNKINSGCRRWCSNKRWNEISHSLPPPPPPPAERELPPIRASTIMDEKQFQRYQSTIIHFMRWKCKINYPMEYQFSVQDLSEILPRDIYKWMCFKVYGTKNRDAMKSRSLEQRTLCTPTKNINAKQCDEPLC